MPTVTLTTPTGEIIKVIHATGSKGAAGKYFNAKRFGLNVPNIAADYEKLIPALQGELIAEIEASGIDFDTVVRAPSSGADGEPYYEAILSRWPVRDLTLNFGPKGAARAARCETSVADMVEAFPYTRDDRESAIRSVLIIDESVATGKTASAIIQRLVEGGVPKDAKFTIAACAKM